MRRTRVGGDAGPFGRASHARAEVVSVCRASGDRRRSTRRFCSGACSRAARRVVVIPIAHQRRIRERCPRDMENIDYAKVEQISYA